MLRIAATLALVAVCYAQTRPVLPETFSATGEVEFHDTRGTFMGQVILERDQAKNMAVENATYKVGNVMEHFEVLERYDMGMRYTVRASGGEEPHCQLEKINGSLPMYWDWLPSAKYAGQVEYHEISYDKWILNTGPVELFVLVLPGQENVPRFFAYRAGPVIVGYSFVTFTSSEPSAKDFDVPPYCSTTWPHTPMSHLMPSL